MIIYIKQRVEEYDLNKKDKVDTDEVGSISENQAQGLLSLRMATTDESIFNVNDLRYTPGKIYRNNENMTKDNRYYQLKDGVTSSDTFVLNEWDIEVQGV